MQEKKAPKFHWISYITCFTEPLKNVMLFPRKDNSVRENIFSSHSGPKMPKS